MFFDPEWLLVLIMALGVTVLAHWRDQGDLPRDQPVRGAQRSERVRRGERRPQCRGGERGLRGGSAPASSWTTTPRTRRESCCGRRSMTGHTCGRRHRRPRDRARSSRTRPGTASCRPIRSSSWRATCGSLIGMILLIGGFLLVDSILVYFGIAMFTATVLAQLFNLPSNSTPAGGPGSTCWPPGSSPRTRSRACGG